METSKLVLTNPTDDELSAAVTEHVAGWKLHRDGYWLAPGETPKSPMRDETNFRPPYATSADAVLPLLEKCDAWSRGTVGGAVTVYKRVLSPVKKPSEDIPDSEWMILKPIGHYWNCQHPKPFPYSACIALLRANGVEVITPQMR